MIVTVTVTYCNCVVIVIYFVMCSFIRLCQRRRWRRRSSGPVDVSSNELMGNIGEVKGRDVVIVDELIDTGGTLAALPRRLKKAGAKVSERKLTIQPRLACNG